MKNKLLPYLTYLCYLLEKDGIVRAFQDKNLFKLAVDVFIDRLEKSYLSCRMPKAYKLSGIESLISFPHATYIHQLF